MFLGGLFSPAFEVIMGNRTKKITITALICALAFAAVSLGRVPVVLFLKYDPKDVIIAIGGFIYGPLTTVIVSVIVSFFEMITISDTGIIGMVMNVLSTCAFATVASFVYKKYHKLKGAVLGLLLASVFTVIVMILWNYLVTPLYMNVPREAVVQLLIPAFLPFNLLKVALNSSLTFLLYRPVVKGLRAARLIPMSETSVKKTHKWIFAVVILLIVSCVIMILSLNGTLAGIFGK